MERSTVLAGTGAWHMAHPRSCCAPWWQLWQLSRGIVLVASTVGGT
jgi:hypothetical protein